MTVLHTFPEVVELTKGVITLDWLNRQATAGTFEHVKGGRLRGLTPAQLDALLDSLTVKPAQPQPVALPEVAITSMTPRSRAHRARRSAL